MGFLQHKTIFILSPQSWGNMFISKHHYAIALAEGGNKVYFISPPGDPRPEEKILVRPSGINENLLIVEHRISFPFWLKFKALPVFHELMRHHIKQLLKKLGTPDIVWSFDIGYMYSFTHFPASGVKIFHPVDEPSAKISIDAANGADVIFSVTQEILDKYSHLPVPRYFVNHGLANEFLYGYPGEYSHDGVIRVGFSGNLLRNDIDRAVFLQIIEENPRVQFECWGAYRSNDSNIGGGADEEQLTFIGRLTESKNVILHGPVPVKKLASEFCRMDAFLICYDVQRDQSKGTNYHKIMEYLGSGKVIISNNVTTYKNREDLIQMIEDRLSNHDLPGLFKKVIENIGQYNSPEKMRGRKQFAQENTYQDQVERIGQCLEGLEKRS